MWENKSAKASYMIRSLHSKRRKFFSNNTQLFFIALMGVVFLAIFAYIPLFGLVLAFKEGDNRINVMQTIVNGKWVGFENFKAVFEDYSFKDVFINTISLNSIMLLINFPAPIIFALFLNEIKHRHYKNAIQSITIFPTFISWMSFGGIFLALLDMNTGVLNPLLVKLGLITEDTLINFGEPQYSWALIIITSLIKGTGWGSIIYTASISGINPEIYESAEMDGAKRFRVMFQITLPAMIPTILVYFLLSIGGILGNNFEQFYVFQNVINLSKTEVLATYSYTQGISYKRYSFATALGLIQSIISLFLLLSSDKIAKKLTGRGIY